MSLKWQDITSYINIVYFRKMFTCSDFSQKVLPVPSNIFSTEENPNRILALTTIKHSAELPTFLPQPIPELLQDVFFYFCILRWQLNTTDAVCQSSKTSVFDQAGDFNSAQVCKNLKKISVYICLLPKHVFWPYEY